MPKLKTSDEFTSSDSFVVFAKSCRESAYVYDVISINDIDNIIIEFCDNNLKCLNKTKMYIDRDYENKKRDCDDTVDDDDCNDEDRNNVKYDYDDDDDVVNEKKYFVPIKWNNANMCPKEKYKYVQQFEIHPDKKIMKKLFNSFIDGCCETRTINIKRKTCYDTVQDVINSDKYNDNDDYF